AAAYARAGRAGLTEQDRKAVIHEQYPNPRNPYFLYPASDDQETDAMRDAWKLLDGLVAKMKDVAEAHRADFLVYSATGCPEGRRWLLKWGHFQTDGMQDYVLWEGERYPADYHWPLRHLETICAHRHIPLIKPAREYDRYEYDPHTDRTGNRKM